MLLPRQASQERLACPLLCLLFKVWIPVFQSSLSAFSLFLLVPEPPSFSACLSSLIRKRRKTADLADPKIAGAFRNIWDH